MAVRKYSNVATEATLTGSITSSDTSVALASFSGFPSAPFTAAIDRGTASEEIVLVTGVAGSTVTMTRGYDGTTAKTHASGATFLHVTVAKDYDEANAHVNTTVGAHGITGSPVGTTDVQTLTNKTLTAPTITSPTITGTTALSSVSVSSTLGVTGATTLGALSVGGAATLSNNLTVSGTTTLTGALTANGGITIPTAKVLTITDAPAVGTSAVNKTYADGLGTSTASVSTIVRRDANGRFAVATPAASSDAATKGYADGLVAGLLPKTAAGKANLTATSGVDNASVAVSFGTTFTTAPTVLLTGTSSAADYLWAFWATNVTTTGCTVLARWTGSGAGSPVTGALAAFWMAVGS